MLSTKNNTRIGFLIDAIDNNFQEHVINGVKAACDELQIDLIIYTGSILFNGGSRDSLYKEVCKYISKNDINGLLILSGSISAHYGIEKTEQIFSSINEIPIVSISTEIAGYTSILVNNELGIEQIFNHLHHDHKLTRIAYAGGPPDHDEARKRFNAYCSCLQNAKLPFDSTIVAHGDMFNENAGYSSAESILSNTKTPIEAIMAVDDCTAMGVINYLNDHGFSVPEDIIVTGFDNIEDSCFFTPSLTTVSQPFFEQGRESVRQLIDIIQHETPAHTIKMTTELIKRDSCGYMDYKSCNTGIYKSTAFDNGHDEFITKYIDVIQSDEWLIQDVSKGLSTALMNDYYEEKSLSPWFEIINKFFIEIEKTNIETTKIIPLYKELTEVVFNFIELEKQRNSKKNANDRFDLYYITHQILSISNKEQLYKALYESIPDFNICSFYICLFNEPFSEKQMHENHEAYIELYYNENIPRDTYLNKKVTTHQLLPPEIMSIENDLIFLPIFFNDLFFGYSIFSYNHFIEDKSYEILRISIGSALYNCMLREKLQQAVQSKTNFLINLTHEIKTPLTIISSYLNKYEENPEHIEDIVIANNNVKKLNTDMQNIIDFEKYSSGKNLYDHNTRINISDFLTEKLTSFKCLISHRKLQLKSKVESNLFIKIAPQGLDRIINNLLENATKYNDEGGIIQVELKKQNSHVIFIIRNTGQLIPEELKDKIFRPYFQLKQNDKHTLGIGMGLNIVKRIINEVKGEIQFSNNKQMNVFTLTFLKVMKPLIKRNEIYARKQPVLINKPVFNEKPPEYNDSLKTILLIEDNPQMIDFLSTQLNSNYNLFAAYSGETALKLLNQMPKPHLIVSDMMLPGIDGIDILKDIQSNRQLQSIPFLFLSANNTEDTQLKALSTGAIDYITKPFTISLLKQKIETLLNYHDKQLSFAQDDIKHQIIRFLDTRVNSVSEKDAISSFIIPAQYTERFTNRETEVIQYLSNGFQYKEIASEMNISLNTLKTYIKRMYNKMEVNNRIELLQKIGWNKTLI